MKPILKRIHRVKKYVSRKKKERSFTLVELLVTTSVIGFLGFIGFINLVNYRNFQNLDTAAQGAATSIRYAQQQSISQDSGSAWGIMFYKGVSNPDYYTIYRGTSSVSGIATVTSTLPSNVYLGTQVDVPFSKLIGSPSSKTTINLYLATNPATVRQITIDTVGTLSLQNITGTTFGSNWQNFGSWGSGINQFSGPNGVYVDSLNNKVYVIDGSGYRIDRFDSGSGSTTFGANWQSFGSNGSGVNQFFFSVGIYTDSFNNKVYVSDSGNNRIVSFDSGSGGTTFGNNWQSFGTLGSGVSQFHFPYGVSVDTTNKKVYVGDSGNNRIVRFDSGSGGTILGNNWQSFGSVGSGINQFYGPNGVYFDSLNNKVYAADSPNYRIVRFDSGSGGTTLGNNWQSFGSAGSGANQLNGPYNLTVDPTVAKVYVSDSGNNRVVYFDSGSGGTTFGNNWQSIGSAGAGAGQFFSPMGISIDSTNHKTYVADGNFRIDFFDSQFP